MSEIVVRTFRSTGTGLYKRSCGEASEPRLYADVPREYAPTAFPASACD